MNSVQKNIKYILFSSIAISFIFTPEAFSQNKISIETYLEQVQKNNPAYKASVDASEGAKLRSKEGTLLTLPQISMDYSKTIDEKDSYTPSISGTKREYENYKISITETTPYGLQGKFSYGQNYILTESASAAFVPQSRYYMASPSIELSQSLWRNGFGSEVRAQREALNASALAEHYAQRARNTAIELEAKNTFYRLYYAQKTISAVKESLGVAAKLQEWAKKRLNQGLGEDSDYLQTKSAYELRALEYQNAVQEEKIAARAFNSLRGSDSDSVNEALGDSEIKDLSKNSLENKWRDDVRAAKKSSEALKAMNLANKEKNKPSLDLYGAYAWNGLDTSDTTAREESFKNTYPNYTVGIRFSTPLALGTSSDIRTGYEKEALAAELNFRRKAQEQARDQKDLELKLENAFARLKLSKSLEESQRLKVLTERKRHQKGRTTFFQVLQFEQDYLNSQLNKIKTEAELNSLLTQVQLYTEEKQGE